MGSLFIFADEKCDVRLLPVLGLFSFCLFILASIPVGTPFRNIFSIRKSTPIDIRTAIVFCGVAFI